MRLGLFGGSFDPPHNGHRAAAGAAAARFALDSVLWIPVGRQPLKRGETTTPFADRLRMVELLCESDPLFQTSTLDAPHGDGAPNYTADTLRLLHRTMPEAELFCLAGADSFADLGRWREPEALLELANWIVLSRPGYALREPEGLSLTEEQRRRVHLLDTVHEDISATALRERLAAGDRCRDLLAPVVAAYIEAHGLYRTAPPGRTAGERVG